MMDVDRTREGIETRNQDFEGGNSGKV